MRAFPATYSSECLICGERIKRGDQIVWAPDEGDYVHEDCPDDLDDAIAGPACPTCWLIGPCDCEEEVTGA